MKESNYTKEQESIRMALTNFVGALYVNSKFTGEVAKSNVNAIIIEELMKLAKDDDDRLNMVAIKPIFNACAWVLRVRKEDVLNDAKANNMLDIVQPSIDKIDALIKDIENYAEKIK